MKYIIFLIPIFSFSQPNDDFLTNLFVDSIEIQNQEFKLDLAGFVNLKAQKVESSSDDDDYYYDNDDDYYLSEILFLDDVLMVQQIKSEVYLGDYDSNPTEFEDRCSWTWRTNKNLTMVPPDSLNLFPTFSFIRGKLLTINQTDSSKDYLFSVSKSSENINYGYKNMSFNLTDDDENAYSINTLIVDGQSFIALTKKEMNRLNFETTFSNNSEFKILCGDNKSDYTTGYGSYYWEDCWCSCETDYLKVFKKQTLHMDREYSLDVDEMVYLFKLVEIL